MSSKDQDQANEEAAKAILLANGVEIPDLDLPEIKGPKKKGRKRKYPDRDILKHLHQTNQPRVNRKGQFRPAKEMPSEFECCEKKCADRIPYVKRKRIFDNFYAFGSYEARSAFIVATCYNYNKMRGTTKNESRRQFSRTYVLEGVNVCKKFYCSTLQISGHVIDRVIKRAEIGDFSDKRGKRLTLTPVQKRAVEQRPAIVEHIKSFQRYKLDERSNVEYLPTHLTGMKGMYNLYAAQCQEKGIEPVKVSFYCNVFRKEFPNLKFEARVPSKTEEKPKGTTSQAPKVVKKVKEKNPEPVKVILNQDFHQFQPAQNSYQLQSQYANTNNYHFNTHFGSM